MIHDPPTNAPPAIPVFNWDEISQKLDEPFPPDVVKQYDAGKAGVFSYITARDVARRLDETVGKQNWSFIPQMADAATGAVLGIVSIYGIPKGDFGYPNNPVGSKDSHGNLLEEEPLKSSCSDAFKRAAVLWGVGRHLHEKDPATGAEIGERIKGTYAGNPATDKQLNFLQTLLKENGFGINVKEVAAQTGMTSKHASQWIENLKESGARATVINPTTGEMVVPSFFQNYSPESEAAEFSGPSPDIGAWPESKPAQEEPTDLPPTKMQLESISKIQQALGVPMIVPEGLTRRAAGDLITTLSNQYNQARSKP